MPKSLRQNRWTRLRDFLRGLLLYNTVYWRKASDEAKRVNAPPGFRNRAEREEQAPQIDQSLVRPRARARPQPPRPKVVAATAPTPPSPDAEKAAAVATATALVAALTQALAQTRSDGKPPKPGAANIELPAKPGPSAEPARVSGVGAFAQQRRRRSDQTAESAPGVLSFAMRRKRRRRSFWRRLFRWK